MTSGVDWRTDDDGSPTCAPPNDAQSVSEDGHGAHSNGAKCSCQGDVPAKMGRPSVLSQRQDRKTLLSQLPGDVEGPRVCDLYPCLADDGRRRKRAGSEEDGSKWVFNQRVPETDRGRQEEDEAAGGYAAVTPPPKQTNEWGHLSQAHVQGLWEAGELSMRSVGVGGGSLLLTCDVRYTTPWNAESTMSGSTDVYSSLMGKAPCTNDSAGRIDAAGPRGAAGPPSAL